MVALKCKPRGQGASGSETEHISKQIFAFFLLLLLATPPVEAAFSRLAQWKLDFIDQTYAGSWRYRPGASPPWNHRCTNSTLEMLLGVHINNDHIAGL